MVFENYVIGICNVHIYYNSQKKSNFNSNQTSNHFLKLTGITYINQHWIEISEIFFEIYEMKWLVLLCILWNIMGQYWI